MTLEEIKEYVRQLESENEEMRKELGIAPGSSFSESVSQPSETPSDLIRDYFQALHDKEYEKIWDMLPEKIREYAYEQGIAEDAEDGADYTAICTNEYYWLKELDLPSRDTFSFDITEEYEEDGRNTERYLLREGINIELDGDAYLEVTVTADDVQTSGSFYLAKADGQWYLLSVVGNDTLVGY